MDYSDVFISYRRTDVEFVKNLYDELKKTGREVWIDWEDILPGVEGFSDEIQRGIERANAFLAVLSPNYLQSEYCIMELREALRLKKRIIPIVFEKFDSLPPPDGIGHINWIFFTPHAGQSNTFEQSFPKIVKALETDFSHVREHTRLLLRAGDWDKSERHSGYLLGGEEIDNAEKWQVTATSKDPTATELQLEYILESRKEHRRQQQRFLAIIAVLLIIATVAAIFAVLQAQEASRQAEIASRRADIAQSYNLAARSVEPGNEAYAVALALQSVSIDNPPVDIVGNLMNVAYRPSIRKIYQLDSQSLVSLASVSSQGNLLLIENRLIDVETGVIIRELGDQSQIFAIASAISPDGTKAVVAGDITPEAQASIENTTNFPYMSLYDTSSGELIRSFQTGIGVERVQFSADGTKIVSFEPDIDAFNQSQENGEGLETFPNGAARWWDVATGEELRQFPHAIAFSPDLSLVATVIDVETDEEKSIYNIQISNTADDTIVSTFQIRSNFEDSFTHDKKLTMSISPENNVAAINVGNYFFTIDISNGSTLSSFAGHTLEIRSLQFSADGHQIVTAGLDESVILWDVDTGKQILNLKGQLNSIYYAAFYGTNQLISVSQSDELIIWDTLPGDLIETRPLDWTMGGLLPDCTPDYCASRVFNDDSSLVLYEDYVSDPDTFEMVSHELVLVDMSAREELERIDVANFVYVSNMAILSDDDHIAVLAGLAHSDGQIFDDLFIYTRGSTEAVKLYEAYTIYSFDFSADMKTILIRQIDEDGAESTRVISADTGEVLANLPISSSYGVFVDGGHQFLLAEDRELMLQLNLYDSQTGNLIRTVLPSTNFSYMLLVPDMQYLITSDNVIGEGGYVTPSGIYIGVAQAGQEMHLWDYQTGSLLRDYPAEYAGTLSIGNDSRSFFADGTSSSLWRLDTLPELIAWVCANRYIAPFSAEDLQRFNISQPANPCAAE